MDGRIGARSASNAYALLMLALLGLACSERRADPEPTAVAETQDRAAAVSTEWSAARGGITAADVAEYIGVLAHDSLAGRATPSPGLEAAARYIAGEFEAWGLEPVPTRDAFLQWYEFEGTDGPEHAPNVVGVLRGADPDLRDSWVVYTAHMDHVGIGPPDEHGDSIYNGADDDASGTAALMEIAEAFTGLGEPPARSIAFVAVSGEERGLHGSRAFVSAGGIAASDMVANINIDMVGRNAPDTLVVIGLEYSDLGPRLRDIAASNPDLGFVVLSDPWPEEQFFFRSDHYTFANAGVPAIFLFAGVHEDYHRPSDHAERIDAGKVARVAAAAWLLGLEIASSPEPPRWTAAGREAMGFGR